MSVVFLLASIVAADPDQGQLDLFKTFRSEFVMLAPGQDPFPAEFEMGGTDPRESPRHTVTLRKPFGMAKYEVPQNLWQAVMGKNPSRWKGPRNSVEMLTFDEAEAFCAKATRLMRDAKLITDKQVIRLPSEAEWEYAARAGTQARYSFGDDAGDLDAHAWHTGNAAGNDPPVGAKKPNPWGLYDMHGYLWEWCSDVEHKNYQGAPVDGSPWLQGGTADRRMIRGGSWKDPAERLTSSYRLAVPKETRDDAIGLRCVLATGD